MEHTKIKNELWSFQWQTVSFTKHLTITVRSLFLIFLWINRGCFVFAKTYGLPFPPPIIECMEALESVHSWKGNCTMCYQQGKMQQILWQNNAIFMFKSYRVPSSTKFIINRAIPGPIIWKYTTSTFFTLRVDKGFIYP